jgi:nicotinamidase-related amidase
MHLGHLKFCPVKKAGEGHGMWKKYYERWSCMTIEEAGKEMFELVSTLARFIPPAQQVDKHVYGPWLETDLHRRLQERGVHTLVISGGETDICVLATVLGAVDLGYRVILAADALCSAEDSTHNSMMHVYNARFSVQIEVKSTEEILSKWER